MEGSGRDLIEVTSQHLYGGTEEYHKNKSSGQPTREGPSITDIPTISAEARH
jgi:hypothetical protein